MKNRVISGLVTVTGPPRSIWRRKIGITEPDEPSTLPKRTATKRVLTSSRRANDSTIHSQTAFDWPSRFLGFAALSVEMRTKRSTPNSTDDLRDHPRREHVVGHRLQRVGLEHRDVLVGGGVEDDLGRVALEDLPHLGRVAAVGEDGDARR